MFRITPLYLNQRIKRVWRHGTAISSCYTHAIPCMCVWITHAHPLHLTLCTIWLQNCIWAQLSHTHTHTQTQPSNLCWDCILYSPSATSAIFSASASLITFSQCAAQPNTWLNWQRLSLTGQAVWTFQRILFLNYLSNTYGAHTVCESVTGEMKSMDWPYWAYAQNGRERKETNESGKENIIMKNGDGNEDNEKGSGERRTGWTHFCSARGTLGLWCWS